MNCTKLHHAQLLIGRVRFTAVLTYYAQLVSCGVNKNWPKTEIQRGGKLMVDMLFYEIKEMLALRNKINHFQVDGFLIGVV